MNWNFINFPCYYQIWISCCSRADQISPSCCPHHMKGWGGLVQNKPLCSTPSLIYTDLSLLRAWWQCPSTDAHSVSICSVFGFCSGSAARHESNTPVCVSRAISPPPPAVMAPPGLRHTLSLQISTACFIWQCSVISACSNVSTVAWIPLTVKGIVRKEETGTTYTIFVGRPYANRPLGMNGRVIKFMLKKEMVSMWNLSNQTFVILVKG